MKRFLIVAAVGLLLGSAACGSKDTNVSTPGGTTVSTTESGGQSRVTVTDGEGTTTTVTSEGGTGEVRVEGNDGAVNVQGSPEAGEVNVQAGGANVQVGGAGGDVKVSVPGMDIAVQGGGDEGTVSVSGDEGATTTTGSDQVDPEAFGVPFYPGAEVVGGGVSTTDTGGVKMTVAGAELKTLDSVDKVAEFYAPHAKGANKFDATTNGQRIVSFTPKDPMNGTTITIMADEGATRINLASHTHGN